MGNWFDDAAKTVFETTTDLMGYDAEWTPISGGEKQTARVHFLEPSSVAKIGDIEYDAAYPIVEYLKGSFTGLRESVDTNEAETIRINIDNVWVSFVTVKDKKLFDGRTIQVKLQRK